MHTPHTSHWHPTWSSRTRHPGFAQARMSLPPPHLRSHTLQSLPPRRKHVGGGPRLADTQPAQSLGKTLAPWHSPRAQAAAAERDLSSAPPRGEALAGLFTPPPHPPRRPRPPPPPPPWAPGQSAQRCCVSPGLAVVKENAWCPSPSTAALAQGPHAYCVAKPQQALVTNFQCVTIFSVA